MEKDELMDLWEKGNKDLVEKQKMDKDMIYNYLNSKATTASRYFQYNIIFFWFIQLINIILLSMNFTGYSNNPTMLWTLAGLLFFSVFTMLYGIRIYMRYQDIQKLNNKLSVIIEKKLKFFRTSHEYWLILITFSTWILSFSLGVLIDNDGGKYPINNKLMFTAISMGMLLFIYLTQKYGTMIQIKTMKATLMDLQQGLMGETRSLEKHKKRFKWLGILMTVLLILFALYGLIRFLNFN
ncbi:MAG: hypothetical protein OEY34_04740 [Cyclobacteriaceae bacterium]|nr:hypothetical protein [Cyclobacteriaceae bacterium]